MQDEKVNILPCCGGHEQHFDHCIVFESGDDLQLPEDAKPALRPWDWPTDPVDGPWAPFCL